MASREIRATRNARASGQMQTLSPVERAFLAYDAAHHRVDLAIGGLALLSGRAPASGEVRRWCQERLPSLPLLTIALAPSGHRRNVWLPLDPHALTSLVGERV